LAVTIRVGRAEPTIRGTAATRLFNALIGVCAFALPFLVWWSVLLAFGVSTVIARTPLGVWRYLVSAPDAADSRASVLQALGQSLPLAAAGLGIALLAALMLAVLGTLWRNLSALLLPVALMLQTMPLVALTPMIVLLFGRGVVMTLVVTVIVTFFPAFITIAQGLAQVPRASIDLLDVYGASRLQKLLKVCLPMSLPYLCTAARLVAPAALLGVMIAEWLATGYGLGNLLNDARGELDYGMIWAVAFVAVTVSVGFYQLVRLFETLILRRAGLTMAVS
jgi:ABC-type nitrate/sulfonate/bicarbonate transport system permease component